MESGKSSKTAVTKEAGFTSVDLLDVAEKDFYSYLCSGRRHVVYVAMHGRFCGRMAASKVFSILPLTSFSGVLCVCYGN